MDPVVVYYDLETTGLNLNYAEVLQIGARCGGMTFSKYIMPQYGVSNGATRKNGLFVEDGRLWRERSEYPVRTTTAEIAWGQFIDFLWRCGDGGTVVLTAHNGFNFDHPILMRSVGEVNLRWQLLEVAPFASDTRALLSRSDCNRRLEQLAAKYGVVLGSSDGALGRVDTMRRLSYELGLYEEDIVDAAEPMATFWQ